MIDDNIKLKQTRNLLNALTRDENRVFYGGGRITKTLINKIKKSDYQKDMTFLLSIGSWIIRKKR